MLSLTISDTYKPLINISTTSPYHFRFASADLAIPILRGLSKRPLYVTAAGMDAEVAAKCIVTMHGADRIPTMMKRVDFLSRRGSVS